MGTHRVCHSSAPRTLGNLQGGAPLPRLSGAIAWATPVETRASEGYRGRLQRASARAAAAPWPVEAAMNSLGRVSVALRSSCIRLCRNHGTCWRCTNACTRCTFPIPSRFPEVLSEFARLYVGVKMCERALSILLTVQAGLIGSDGKLVHGGLSYVRLCSSRHVEDAPTYI